MTARRIAAGAVRVALGAAALAAVVGASWVAGSMLTGPNAGHGLRICLGLFAVGPGVFLTRFIAQLAHDTGDLVVDAWRERRR